MPDSSVCGCALSPVHVSCCARFMCRRHPPLIWLHLASEKAMAEVVPVTRLHSAMGAAVAWEPAGQHVASVALDGTIVVMVRSCAEP